MTRKLLGMAVAASLLAPAMAAQATIGIQRSPDMENGPVLGSWGRKGKGKGKRPNHSSRRFVAMDKREARKARNRR